MQDMDSKRPPDLAADIVSPYIDPLNRTIQERKWWNKIWNRRINADLPQMLKIFKMVYTTRLLAVNRNIHCFSTNQHPFENNVQFSKAKYMTSVCIGH